MSNNDTQAETGNNAASAAPAVADAATNDVGGALNDLVHGLAVSSEAGGEGPEGLNPAAAHSIGDIVASIASFDPANPHAALDHLGSDHGTGTADVLHDTGHVDLSDVGSILSHAGGDVASSNLDLDHLTSNLNLFDVSHFDTGLDGGHHT